MPDHRCDQPVADVYLGPGPAANPFRCRNLPVIARLNRLKHRRYAKRWRKRLCKKPAHWLYEAAYRSRLFAGAGVFTASFPTETKTLSFNARKAHFGALYFPECAVFGYEAEVSSLIRAFLKGDAVFYDVGANWGYFSLFAATLSGASGAVHAFEPIAETAADLKQLVADGGLEGRITVHEIALSDTDGTVDMLIRERETGLNRIPAAPTCAAVQAVPVRRLDGLGVTPPGVIKMDIEEHEAQALRGAEETLRRAAPVIIFENWRTPEEPCRSLRPLRDLERLGYALFQPMWAFDANEETFLWPDATGPGPDIRSDGRLALARLHADQRYALAAQLNLVAVPKIEAAARLADAGFAPL